MHIAISALVILTAALLTACAGGERTDSGGTPALPAGDTAAARRLISPDETLETLSFPAVGGTRVSGTISGHKGTACLVPVSEGQTLTVTLESPAANAYFNLHEAADSSGFAVFNGNSGERTPRLAAPKNMTYFIRPFQPRASAQREEQVPFSLAADRG